jgi:hypothetical protein
MKTIEFIEKQKTKKLQDMLKYMEFEQNKVDVELDKYFNSELKKISDDYEIDIHLIRMELSKRLWFNDFEK